MTLNFNTSPQDYIILLNRIVSKSSLGKAFSTGAWITISVLSWLSVILPLIKFHEFGWGFWTRASLAIVITICWPYFYDRYCAGVFTSIINEKTMSGFAGETIVTVSEQSITCSTQSTIAGSKKTDVYALETTKDHIYIFFTPIIAVPIPLSAFKTPSEVSQFLLELKS